MDMMAGMYTGSNYAGFDEILMPGEPEERKTQKAKEEGILISGNIQESLYAECVQRKVTCDDILDTPESEVDLNAGSIVFQKDK